MNINATREDPRAVPRPLREAYPSLWPVPVLLALTVTLLVIGQVLPGVTIHTIGREANQYSVFGGVRDLWRGGNELLACVLFCFSILFPAVKCGALIWIWFLPMQPRRRANFGHWLKPLGKWSMLDTFVVIALVGAVQLRKMGLTLATAYPEPAVYLFASAIVLSILLSFWIARLADDQAGDEHFIPKLDLSLLLAPWGAAGCLVAAFFYPVMLVEKKMFESSYELVTAARALEGSHEYALLGVFLLFVLVLPLVYFVGLGVLTIRQWQGKTIERALSMLVAMERWAMVDVFFLGVLLVYAKVGAFANVIVSPGFWLIAAAAGLSVYCAARVRRVY